MSASLRLRHRHSAAQRTLGLRLLLLKLQTCYHLLNTPRTKTVRILRIVLKTQKQKEKKSSRKHRNKLFCLSPSVCVFVCEMCIGSKKEKKKRSFSFGVLHAPSVTSSTEFSSQQNRIFNRHFVTRLRRRKVKEKESRFFFFSSLQTSLSLLLFFVFFLLLLPPIAVVCLASLPDWQDR